MTTIAYKDGILVADTQLTMGGMKFKSDPKIVILPNGVVFSASGPTNVIMEAVQFFSKPDWDKKLDEAPKTKKTIEIILVSKGRVYYCYNNCLPVPLEHRFWSIGSGWQIAASAMHMGLSAEEAVKFAGELNIHTNQEVQVVNVQDLLYEEAPKRARGSSKRKTVPQA